MPQARLRGTRRALLPNPSTASASSEQPKSVHSPTKCHWDPRAEQPLCTLCYLFCVLFVGETLTKLARIIFAFPSVGNPFDRNDTTTARSFSTSDYQGIHSAGGTLLHVKASCYTRW